MLSGDNSILSKTTDAKERTERAEIIETAQMDILGKQAQNHGSLSEEELVEILTSSDYNTKGILSDNGEESVLQKTLTSSNGKYEILVSEIYNGTLIGASSGNSLEALKTKIAKESGDCMIDEDGNIMPISAWRYEITGNDTCKLCGESDNDEDNPTIVSAYNGNVKENGSLEYEIPVFLRVEGKIYQVTELSTYFLYSMSELKNLTIPGCITAIGNLAFYNCSSIENLELPNSIYEIGSCAFENCSKLTDIKIPERVQRINSSTFRNCSMLTNVDFPEGLKGIGMNSFELCSMLTNVIIPNSVEYIGYNAFSVCTSLKSITIPDSVTLIQQSAFSNCTNLTSVALPRNLDSIAPFLFCACTSLTDISIPESVTEIDRWAFYGCTALTNLKIPDGVIDIENDAFKDVPHIQYNGSATGSPWGAKAMN